MVKLLTKMENSLDTGITIRPEQVATGSTKREQIAVFGHLMIMTRNPQLVIGTIWTIREQEPGMQTQLILLSGI